MRLIAAVSLVIGLATAMPLPAASATSEGVHLAKQDWSFDGPLGTYDRNALQRGFKVYKEVCAGCHSLKKLSYRNLEALGYDENQVKAIASEYTVIDGPDDEGEMFERPALPSDKFVSPYANDAQGKASNNGALPPDFSLLTKARVGGADYIFGILTGYEDPPEGKELLDGQYWNAAMPGHVIAMAKPIDDGMVSYEDGTPEILEQYAKDVAEFMTWAADPYMEERKQTGIKVIFYLTIFAGLMYAIKKRLWSEVH